MAISKKQKIAAFVLLSVFVTGLIIAHGISSRLDENESTTGEIVNLARARSTWAEVRHFMQQRRLQGELVELHHPKSFPELAEYDANQNVASQGQSQKWVVIPSNNEAVTSKCSVIIGTKYYFSFGPWQTVLDLYFDRTKRLVGLRKRTVPPFGM